MRLNIGNILKFSLSTAVVLGTAKVLQYVYYVDREKYIAQRPVNDALFVMNDGLPCCQRAKNGRTAENCSNPHCKAKLSHRIIKEIESAQQLVCIAMYQFTHPHVKRAILDAMHRGVKVRIITDFSMIKDRHAINDLQLKGVPIRIAGTEGNGDNYMHNKFCLIDVLNNESDDENKNPANGILINGSMNWTVKAFDGNWENIQFISDNHLKSEFKKAFDFMWSRLDSPNVPGTFGI